MATYQKKKMQKTNKHFVIFFFLLNPSPSLALFFVFVFSNTYKATTTEASVPC